jgi:hypothetical protein
MQERNCILLVHFLQAYVQLLNQGVFLENKMLTGDLVDSNQHCQVSVHEALDDVTEELEDWDELIGLEDDAFTARAHLEVALLLEELKGFEHALLRYHIVVKHVLILQKVCVELDTLNE